MGNKNTIVVPLDPTLKAKLDAKRAEGWTINTFVRVTLTKALKDVKVPKRAA